MDNVTDLYPYEGTQIYLEKYLPEIPDERIRSHSAPAKSGGERPSSSSSSSSTSSSSESVQAQEGANTKESSEQSEQWRKFSGSIFGHAPYITQRISGIKNPKCFILANIFQGIFLSVSNTIFISNPLSGLIILSTMFYTAPISAFFGLVSLISGIFTALWVVRLPMPSTIGGSFTFNCFLLGSLIAPLSGGVISLEQMLQLIPICIATGIFTIFTWVGLNAIFSLANVPVLNAPCNILSLIFIFSGLSKVFMSSEHSSKEIIAQDSFLNLTYFNEGGFNGTKFNLRMRNQSIMMEEEMDENDVLHVCDNWCGIIGGIIQAQSQIFQTNSIVTSSLIYFSILLYSPILFFQQLLGAAIGTLIGLGLSEQPLIDVYNGSWGYNSLLTSAAVGGFFIALNFQSWVFSIFASILTALTYSALIKNGLPGLGIPFMLVTWLFIPIASFYDDGLEDQNETIPCLILKRVTVFSTPENHRRCSNKLISNQKYRRPKSTVLPI